MAATTDHAGWTHPALDSSSSEDAVHVASRRTSAYRPLPADEDIATRVQNILAGNTVSAPDARARARVGAALYRATRWPVFDDGAERAYVSRLWAEDWDCPEDAAYDEL